MKISVVTPVYREEHSIPEFLRRTVPILEQCVPEFEIIFALDPSPDATEDVITQACNQDPRIKMLSFSRRFGQTMATLAGLEYASGEAMIVMDVDLQDPPELIPEMVAKYKEGFDVIYAQRKSREGLTFAYNLITTLAYKIIQKFAEGIEIPENTGDFRLLSRRAVNEVLKLKESHGFFRGMVALVGFRQTAVLFDRPPRQHGSNHYNRYIGSVRGGLNGLICFSSYPLTLTTFFGFGIAALSFLVAFIYGLLKIFGVPFPLGNPTVVILILLLAGVQLISVGILGEYIGRIYDEVKQRPRFIIDKKIGF